MHCRADARNASCSPHLSIILSGPPPPSCATAPPCAHPQRLLRHCARRAVNAVSTSRSPPAGKHHAGHAPDDERQRHDNRGHYPLPQPHDRGRRDAVCQPDHCERRRLVPVWPWRGQCGGVRPVSGLQLGRPFTWGGHGRYAPALEPGLSRACSTRSSVLHCASVALLLVISV